MAQQKLYTEEQVKSMINRAKIFDGDVKENFVYILSESDILSAETPIEIPSDEDIDKEAFRVSFDDAFFTYTVGVSDLFIKGAKWMKEKILNQNK